MPSSGIRLGLDVLLSDPALLSRLRKRRVGLLTNRSGRNRDLRRNIDLLLECGISLQALFTPEHGLTGALADGAAVPIERDPRTGLVAYPTYGNRELAEAKLREVDLVLFDIQDVGARCYTFLSTLLWLLEIGVEVWVLDRPNPISGTVMEGGLLRPEFRSFVGPLEIPLRHGMTLGELAQMAKATHRLPGPLRVVPMEGWARTALWADTGLPWLFPSPGIPTPETALVYPGTVMIEGTYLSEGRGTSRPFFLVGAPWVEGWKLEEELRGRELLGVTVVATDFRPTSGKHRRKWVSGIEIVITEPRSFRPVAFGLHLLHALQTLWPGKLRWRTTGGRPWIDLITGSDRVRRALRKREDPRCVLEEWAEELADFAEHRKPYLLYP